MNSWKLLIEDAKILQKGLEMLNVGVILIMLNTTKLNA